MLRFRNFRKYLLLLISIPLLCNQPEPASACWYDGSEGDDIRFVLFRPDLGENPAWTTFYYTYFYYYGQNSFDWPKDAPKFTDVSKDDQQIVRQWKDALKASVVRDTDLYEILFNTRPDNLLNGQTDPEKAFPGNTFIQALQKPANQALWAYLLDLKEAEKYMMLNVDWDMSETQQTDYAAQAESLVQRLSRKLEKQDLSNFLKPRYAFTLLRLRFYNTSDKTEGIAQIKDLYNRYLAPLPKTDILQVWGLHYLAQIEPDAGRCAYLNALVFDRSDSKKVRSHQLFVSANADKALPFAQNASERSAIRTLRELNNPGKSLDNIRKILADEPDSKYLALLVGREINKLENWIFTPEYLQTSGSIHHSSIGVDDWDQREAYTRYPQKWRVRDLEYLRTLRKTMQTALPKTKTNADLLNLAVAHLYLLDQQAAAALPFITAVQRNTPVYALQKRLLEFSYLMQTANLNTPETQQKMVEVLRWLEQNQSKILTGPRTFSMAMALLANTYKKSGQADMVALLQNRGELKTFFGGYCSVFYSHLHYLDQYGDLESVQSVINRIEKKNKTPFEAFLTEQYANAHPFYDLLGTMYLRRGQTEKALSIFEKVPDTYWNTAYEYAYYLEDDPFHRIRMLAMPETFDVYNKKTMAARLLTLEKNVQALPAQSDTSYLELGNAWYNFSKYGNSWMFMTYGWSEHGLFPTFISGELPDVLQPEALFKANYYRMEKAEYYYKKALETSQNAELKAHAAFMLALIDQNRYFQQPSKKEVYVGEFGKQYYVQFQQTKFFKDHPCPMIENFMQKK